jgi:magnesium-transporting ATPase (P-type)
MAFACWPLPTATWNANQAYAKADECDLVLRGYIAFFDPPKESTMPAIAACASTACRSRF